MVYKNNIETSNFFAVHGMPEGIILVDNRLEKPTLLQVFKISKYLKYSINFTVKAVKPSVCW